MSEFVPLNMLEQKLLSARQARIPVSEFLQELWSSLITLPTHSEVQSDGSGFRPIIFDKLGANMMAAFTSKERLSHLQHLAKYCMVMQGGDALRRIPKGYGLVINPGLDVGLEISPAGIDEIIGQFG